MSAVREKKILFIVPSLAVGGAERIMLTLYEGIVCRDKKMLSVSSENGFGVQVAEDGGIMFLGRTNIFCALPSLWRFIRAYQPDMIVSTLARMNLAILLLRFFLPKHIKYIVRETTALSGIAAWGGKRRAAGVFYKWLYPKADIVLCPGRAVMDDLRDHVRLPSANLAVMYNMVDQDRVRSAAERDFIKRKAGLMDFVCVGRLVGAKGYDDLIKALAGASFPFAWRLSIYGDGPERGALETLIRKNRLSERIFLKGYTDNPWAAMAAADMLLLPSRREGMPNVVLESLAVGTPVLALARAGSIDDIAEQANGHVAVVSAMDGMLGRMAAILISAHDAPRPSLLPRAFQREAGIARFERLLSQAAR